MTDVNDEDNQPMIDELADHAIVAHAVAPLARPVADHGCTELPRIVRHRDSMVYIVENALGLLAVQLAD